MHKIILASAAAVLTAAGAAQAQMLLYENTNDSKVTINEWVGQTFDPVTGETTPALVGPPTRYALVIAGAHDPHLAYPLCPTPAFGAVVYQGCLEPDFDAGRDGSDGAGDLNGQGLD